MMTYRDGTWGSKAKKRSIERKKYFLEYQKKKRGSRPQFIAKGSTKRNARQRVRDHILAGKIIKPKKCQRCNQQQNLEGHHPDYSKPLEVLWLCKNCHIKAHKKVIR